MIHFKAIAAGFLTWVGLEIFFSIAINVAFGRAVVKSGYAALSHSTVTPVWAVLSALGMIVPLAAGFVTAKIAGDKGARSALILGIVMLAIGLLTTRFRPPLWLHLAEYITVVPTTLLGGYLAKGRRYRGDSSGKD